MLLQLIAGLVLGCVFALCWQTCPSIGSFLTFMSGAPLPHRYPPAVRESLRLSDQLGHALIRARVAAAIETENYFFVRFITLPWGLSFYGCLGHWHVYGRHKNTALQRALVAFRDRSPMLDVYQEHDPGASHWIAHEWHYSEQILMERGPDMPVNNFKAIAKKLMSIPSSVAKVDAALACLIGWHYTEKRLMDYEEVGTWFLTHLVDLVKVIAHLEPQLVQWIGITVADMLTELGQDTYDLCRSMARLSTWPLDDMYYRCISKVADTSLSRGDHAMVIKYSGMALRYYRKQHELDMGGLGRLAFVRSLSLIALGRWDEWFSERSQIKGFGMASPELVFLVRLYSAWANLDMLLFESACRDLDRACSINDVEIKYIAKAKARLAELQGHCE